MNLTNPKREKTQKPTCPNCGTDLTGNTRNWGSEHEGDYIVYNCPTCAEYFAVSYTHLRAHETVLDIVCRLLLNKKKHTHTHNTHRYT